VRDEDTASGSPFGMNWKMSAKTILGQGPDGNYRTVKGALKTF
jgi:hypothetical protein